MRGLLFVECRPPGTLWSLRRHSATSNATMNQCTHPNLFEQLDEKSARSMEDPMISGKMIYKMHLNLSLKVNCKFTDKEGRPGWKNVRYSRTGEIHAHLELIEEDYVHYTYLPDFTSDLQSTHGPQRTPPSCQTNRKCSKAHFQGSLLGCY